MIAIGKVCRKDYLAHRVRYSKADSRYCYELYSTELLQALRHTVYIWRTTAATRIYGALNPKKKMSCSFFHE